MKNIFTHHNLLMIVGHHLLMLYGIYYYGFNSIIAIIIFLYSVCYSLAITGKLIHNGMCHKGYTGSFLDHFATICSLVSGSSGSPIAFSYVHRLHHKFTDTENDPHSPKHIGRWRVWLLLWRVSSFRPSYIKDFITSQYQIALHRHWTKIQILVMITVYLINPIILLLIISPCVVISFHCSGLINVLGHWNGEARNINELRFLPDASWKHFEHHKKY